MNDWLLSYDGFEPEQEKLREALCTLGNGYFATRGAAPESAADGIHYPGTYLAGGYNRLKTELSGRTVENEDLVNLPNWLPLTFRIDNAPWFDLRGVDILSYRQELDIARGLLIRSIRFRDGHKRETTLHQRRLVHANRMHLAALETTLRAENWSGAVEFRCALDGTVENSGVERYRQLNGKHLEPMAGETLDEETDLLKVQTSQSELRIALAARTRVFGNNGRIEVESRCETRPGHVSRYCSVDMEKGQDIRVEKTVALFTSRDHAISECSLEAGTQARGAADFAELLKEHVLAWRQLWGTFGLELRSGSADENSMQQQMTLRLHIFHLLQSVSLFTLHLDVGVPSRGWHGEAYRGHIFWDELFIFPLLNLRLPEITRTLLLYRYRRLPEALSAAREAGLRGAMYPWQSGSNGREESQALHLNPKSGRWIPDNSRLQRHVNSAIAYNIWQYYETTDDLEFMSCYGAEMLFEIARFWASLATWNDTLERYEILGVMGPDEYHDGYPDSDRPGIDNNAYTNLLAVWVLCRALDLLEHLPGKRTRELRDLLGLQDEEIERWERISRTMRLVFHGDGIISQFEGYDQLEELDWESYRREHGPVMRLDRILEAEDDTPNRYKASKQADVLMLFYLFSAEELKDLFERLGYPFEYGTIPNNIEYYLRRTSHGSTLSQIVHSWVLARSDRQGSWDYFTMALRSDVGDIQGGTTPEGIHLGAMAGSVDIIQRCYTGIETRDGVLHLNPALPENIDCLRMAINYRRQRLELKLHCDTLSISCLQCNEQPVTICFRKKLYHLEGGSSLEFNL